VKFFYIYSALAHPEVNGFVAPFTLQERLEHVAEAKRQLRSRFHWICDSMTNDLKHALGGMPNGEFVVDPTGRIVHAARWSDPVSLRADLTDFVGEVAPATTTEQTDVGTVKPLPTMQKGVVPRIELPARMIPIKLAPVRDDDSRSRDVDPFYVKLRAEIEETYFETGAGKLYLGFFLDPLYRVHWNNRSCPIHYKISAPDLLQIDPVAGTGVKADGDADADPREFLADLEGQSLAPIRLTVQYVVCDDAETFCKAVTQQYVMVLAPDPDGGSRRAWRP
jgi:hypothetical protein